jgi:hypothetical protein
MASPMLCCMISTKSDIHLLHDHNTKKNINQTYLILTHFIFYGVADTLLHDLHKISKKSINLANPYPFIHHGVANALLHDSTQSEINQ